MLLTDFKPKDMLDRALIVIDFGFKRDATDDRRDDRGGQFFPLHQSIHDRFLSLALTHPLPNRAIRQIFGRGTKPGASARQDLIHRGDRIRTCDLVVPNDARYQAALHPVFLDLRGWNLP